MMALSAYSGVRSNLPVMLFNNASFSIFLSDYVAWDYSLIMLVVHKSLSQSFNELSLLLLETSWIRLVLKFANVVLEVLLNCRLPFSSIQFDFNALIFIFFICCLLISFWSLFRIIIISSFFFSAASAFCCLIFYF